MSRRTAILAIAACCSYPLLNHLGAVTQEPLWPASGIALVTWALLSGRFQGAGAVFLGLLTLGLGIGLSSLFPGVLLYAPPLALNLALCAAFAGTLRPGREPLVGRFARIERGSDLPPDLVRYTRVLTGLWAAFFALMAVVSLSLALWGSTAAWSLFTNLLNYALVVVFFALEYLYRRLRYRHYRHASPGELVRRLHTYRIFPRHADGS
ncbi:MAG: hypothetical protein OEP48_09620 [Betaproteobacteria bacterium]|nr:hypothetical protein [Betaproteobacteria bacterium]MDH3435485.1 hypothetical protein [Betaproteobacteria bacterium]